MTPTGSYVVNYILIRIITWTIKKSPSIGEDFDFIDNS